MLTLVPPAATDSCGKGDLDFIMLDSFGTDSVHTKQEKSLWNDLPVSVWNRDSDIAHAWIRVAFWAFGLTAGAILAYTTRYYLNGDGINYIEMGDALRHGHWSGLVNLTESPGYAFLLGLGQIVLNTNRLNELQLLKSVNFVCFVVAMAACELFVSTLKRQYSTLNINVREPLPFPVIRALTYGMFLFSTLSWIRLRLVAPEMMVFVFMVTSTSIVLWIKEDPDPYIKFVLLGVSTALGYLFKSFFFPFSAVFFVLGGLASGSLRKAVPRMILAALVMLVVSGPLIFSLSRTVGRFSFGEVGNFCYTTLIAGEGELTNPPKVLDKQPAVFFYKNNPFVDCTRPAGFDPCYWNEGIKPVVHIVTQLKVIPSHVLAILFDSPWLFIASILWLIMQWRIGSLSLHGLWPPSMPLILFTIAAAGTGLYCLVHVEMRYLAAFLFLAFVAVLLLPVYDFKNSESRWKVLAGAGVLAALILGMTLNTVVDQSIRGLHSTGKRLSYKGKFLEMLAIKDFLARRGVNKGDDVAMVGLPLWYWGRLARVKIVAEVTDENQFVSATAEERSRAIDSLKSAGVKALVGKGPALRKLTDEGWELVPGTRDFSVLFLSDARPRESLRSQSPTPLPERSSTFKGMLSLKPPGDVRTVLLDLARLSSDFPGSPLNANHSGATLRKLAHHEDGAVEQEPSSPHVSQDIPITLASNSLSGLKAGPNSSGPVAWHTGHSRGAVPSVKKIFANSLPHSRHL
jgi:hypothetical protein